MKTPSGVEIIPVNGDVENASADAQKRVAAAAAAVAAAAANGDGKGSKLESALDRLGFNKRKVSKPIDCHFQGLPKSLSWSIFWLLYN